MSRLHGYDNRIHVDRNNFIRIGHVRLCRYLPERHSFEFAVNDTVNGRHVKRFVEVEPHELIERLSECLT
jgi:hypothetical protein